MSASVIMVFASQAAADTFKKWMQAEGGLHLIAYSQTKDPKHGIGQFCIPTGHPDTDKQFTVAAVTDRRMRNRAILCIPSDDAIDTLQSFFDVDEGIKREVTALRNAAADSIAERFGGPVFGDAVRKLLAGESVAMTQEETAVLERFNATFPGIAAKTNSVPIWPVKNATPAGD